MKVLLGGRNIHGLFRPKPSCYQDGRKKKDCLGSHFFFLPNRLAE